VCYNRNGSQGGIVRVNFYADLRPLASGKTVEVKTSAPMTARQVLEAVTNPRPTLAEKIWQAPGALYDHIHVFINGRQSIFVPQGMDTVLGADDELDVFPPVGGGEDMARQMPGAARPRNQVSRW
jgi:molybdopterin synthase sulfur carrier subunit